jgi:pimeloyl-ACP methyl ester carboxylesterase
MTNFHLDHDLTLTVDEAGTGRPALILHGGGGPATVAMIAGHLAERMHTITPTLPGWNGAQRPDRLDRVIDYAMTYLRYLHARDLNDVLVIGSSMGGWIGAEMAARDTAGRISGLVLIDATGAEIPGEPITDFFALDPRGVAEKSFHNPDRFFADPSTVPAEQLAIRQANMATMRLVAGTMSDPTLLDRLDRVRVPVLGIWGDSDGFVTPAYGKAYVGAFPEGRFEIVKDAGHLPQIEQPAATFALIDEYADR